MLDFLGDLRRTHTCGTLRPANAGQRAVLMGWVNRLRDHGNLIFVDLRDRTGVTQVVFNKELNPALHEKATRLGSEYVIAVTGLVKQREPNLVNKNIATGEIELVAQELRILNVSKTPPFLPGESVLPNEEVRRLIHAAYPLEPLGRQRHGTARRWRFADGQGEIGFISPVSEPFCGDCNRIRITAEGKLRTCLFSLTETDLRGPLRAGASDDELERIVRAAVWEKELKHHVNDPGFVQPARSMSQIGG